MVLVAVQGRKRLTRHRQHGRLVAQLHHITIGLDNLIGSAGATLLVQEWRATSQVFDRLMSWAVFSVAHGIMGEQQKSWQFHDRGQANGGPRIVAEDKDVAPKARSFERESPFTIAP